MLSILLTYMFYLKNLVLLLSIIYDNVPCFIKKYIFMFLLRQNMEWTLDQFLRDMMCVCVCVGGGGVIVHAYFLLITVQHFENLNLPYTYSSLL